MARRQNCFKPVSLGVCIINRKRSAVKWFTVDTHIIPLGADTLSAPVRWTSILKFVYTLPKKAMDDP